MNFISEEQRTIVLDKSRIKLVNGVAGGRKTNSLIKCGIHYLLQGKNVIFLTKISSVTDEITKRMTRDYHIQFEKSASHFVGTYENGHCSVANFDSFIDKQLRNVGIPFEGEAFNQKVKQLTKNLDKLNNIVMKNDHPIDVVLIDEVQDFDKIRVEFTAKLFNHFTQLIGVFVGDTLQTVFVQSIMGESYSMNHLKSNLSVKYFELSTCYRCPKGQIDFVNQVMGPYQQRYAISPIKSNNQNLVDKPVLFQHHSVHKEYQRTDLCERVIHIIDYVLNKDTTITPDDIVVVMNKTNSNAVFEKLLVTLNGYYKQRYNCDDYQHVIHYKTKNHEGRKTIDWSVGEEKTKFISIHGIKGKGQRVVILLGMSEKAFPW
jgi:thymidine kinase